MQRKREQINKIKKAGIVNKVANTYHAYSDKNKGIKKKQEEMIKKTREDLKKLYQKPEKEQREYEIQIQIEILEMLQQQYNLMQENSNLIA